MILYGRRALFPFHVLVDLFRLRYVARWFFVLKKWFLFDHKRLFWLPNNVSLMNCFFYKKKNVFFVVSTACIVNKFEWCIYKRYSDFCCIRCEKVFFFVLFFESPYQTTSSQLEKNQSQSSSDSDKQQCWIFKTGRSNKNRVFLLFLKKKKKKKKKSW